MLLIFASRDEGPRSSNVLIAELAFRGLGDPTLAMGKKGSRCVVILAEPSFAPEIMQR